MCLIVLHPKYKLRYFKKAGWESSWIENAEQLMHDRFVSDYENIMPMEQVNMGYSGKTEDSMLLASGLCHCCLSFITLNSNLG